MKLFKMFLAVALLATSLSSLSAQTSYYATVEVEGQDTVLCIRGYAQKPQANDKVIFIQDQVLTEWQEGDINLVGENANDTKLSHSIKRVVFDIDQNFKPNRTTRWFWNFVNLEKVEGIEKLNTSNVQYMNIMFCNCKSLKELDLSTFDTENVMSMEAMFKDCSSLETLDISSFKGDRTNMTCRLEGMFQNCSSLKNLNLSKVSNLKTSTMQNMFNGCSSLTALDLKGFVYKNVTTYMSAFKNCSSLETIDFCTFTNEFKDNQGGSANIRFIFDECTSLNYIFATEGCTPGIMSPGTYSAYKNCTNLIAYTSDGTEITNDRFSRDKRLSFADSYFGSITKKTNIVDAEVGILPSKTVYQVGEDLDLSGGYITRTVQFAGSKQLTHKVKLLPLDFYANKAQGFDNTKPNTSTISVVYGDQTLTFEVVVEEADELIGLSIEAEPSRKEYPIPFTLEDLDLSGGKIKKIYKKGTGEFEASVNMEACTYTIKGLDAEKLGEQTLEVEFSLGDTVFVWNNYKIEVVDTTDAKVALKLISEPTKTKYYLGEKLDIKKFFDGIILGVEWKKGKVDTINIGEDVKKSILYIESGMASLPEGVELSIETFINTIKKDLGVEIDTFSTEKLGTQKLVFKHEELECSCDIYVVDPTFVEGLDFRVAAFEVWASGGVLSVKVARGGVLEVLGVNGVLVRRMEVAAGASVRVALERGIYVLRMGSEVKKVVVE